MFNNISWPIKVLIGSTILFAFYRMVPEAGELNGLIYALILSTIFLGPYGEFVLKKNKIVGILLMVIVMQAIDIFVGLLTGKMTFELFILIFLFIQTVIPFTVMGIISNGIVHFIYSKLSKQPLENNKEMQTEEISQTTDTPPNQENNNKYMYWITRGIIVLAIILLLKAFIVGINLSYEELYENDTQSMLITLVITFVNIFLTVSTKQGRAIILTNIVVCIIAFLYLGSIALGGMGS